MTLQLPDKLGSTLDQDDIPPVPQLEEIVVVLRGWQKKHPNVESQGYSGLGLTLAKKFVELHGGRIWVESQVCQGSTFSFTLPVRT